MSPYLLTLLTALTVFGGGFVFAGLRYVVRDV
jgi:hypothetical protein